LLSRHRKGASIDAGASRVFALSLIIAAGALGAIGVALADGTGAARVGPHESVGHFRVLHESFSYPRANAAAVIVLILAGLGLFVLLQLTWAVVAEVRAQRRFSRAIAARHPRPHGAVCLVDDPEPRAFCAGFLRPRIYLSTGTLRQLGDDELEAVLAHEEHHRQRRDPLRIAIARVFSHAFFFLPILRRLSDRYCAMAELAADDAAVQNARGGGATLASALLSFSAAAHPHGAVGIAPERVDHLLGRTPTWQLPAALLVGGSATVVVLGALAWQAGQMAVVKATFSLPFLSTRPCVMALALVPGILAAVGVTYLRRPAR
jgi:Zn-dependent protease with chaperone function